MLLVAPAGAAQTPEEIAALDAQVVALYRQGHYAQAIPLAEQAHAASGKLLGAEHLHTVVRGLNLARALSAAARHDEAEPLYLRALEVRQRVLGKEHADTLDSMNALGLHRLARGDLAEAEALFAQVLAARERVLGKEHPHTLASLANLATAYRRQSRYAQAAPLAERAFRAFERLSGPDHENTLTAMNNLATLYYDQGRYAETEPLFRRALEARERRLGKDHPDTLRSVFNLAALHEKQGRSDAAEALFRRVLESRERTLGKEHPETLSSASRLALHFSNRGRTSEAEALYRRALEAQERLFGTDHEDTITSLNNLAVLLRAHGREGEAEALYRRAIAAAERVYGRDHASTLTLIANLGDLARVQGRFAEAEPLLLRAIEGNARLLGNEHPSTLAPAANIARLYMAQERHADAEPVLAHVLAASERTLGADHRDTLTAVGDLADLYAATRRESEAEPLMRRVADARERLLGAEHPHTLTALNNLAELYRKQARYPEAEPLYARVAGAAERAFGPADPRTGLAYSNLATLHFALSDWAQAAAFWRRSAAAMERRIRYGLDTAGQALTGSAKRPAGDMGAHFAALVKAAFRLAPEDRPPSAALAREMFRMAQWAVDSDAAQSLAEMAARGAGRDPAIAALIRERQDLLREWQKLEQIRNAALARTPDERDVGADLDGLDRLGAIEARIAAIDKEVARGHPDYAAIAAPVPLSVEEVQAQLRPDEALVMILDTDEIAPAPAETFLWVVTSGEVHWRRAGLGGAALADEVAALRCGLDAQAWAGGERCRKLTGQGGGGGVFHALPFDLARAHRLYQALFAGTEELIRAKHLLIAASGPLTQLPFQALVTAPAAERDWRGAAWLARDHALTVLPAVASLKALRRTGAPSGAREAFIGFGNPLLDGPDEAYAREARLARDKQRCRETALERIAGLFAPRRGLTAGAASERLSDVSFIRQLAPLPETADELCAVAKALKVEAGHVHLGAQASESGIKALSESGRLADYRIVHFATHGAVAGELAGSSEPGLVLTPPATASARDDGYLSASEIAALRLDAEWVILSACNTAAGEAPHAEALSGLARAFIYAQARALLVSHWAVDSIATVKLITGAVREMAAGRNAGRAQALRRAMLALIEEGEPHLAHPAYWAPFVLVGEGGR